MDALISAAGFSIVEMKTEYAKGPRLLSYIYAGSAQPARASGWRKARQAELRTHVGERS